MTGYFLQGFHLFGGSCYCRTVSQAIRFRLGIKLFNCRPVVIGPVIGLVGSETTTIQHFAEFGVVMMLFVVGLELEPKNAMGYATSLIRLRWLAGDCDRTYGDGDCVPV